MLCIFMLLFCALSNGIAKSIINVKLKDDFGNHIAPETEQSRTSKNNTSIKPTSHTALKNEQKVYLGNDTHQIVKTINKIAIKHVASINVTESTLITINVPDQVHIAINVTERIRTAINVTERIRTAINVTEQAHILYKIHRTITRSKDAIWATITLTFMCVLLVLAVAQSKMWKDYNGSESQGVPLPNFNERVLFKDVMERRITTLKEMFKKKKKKSVTELEALLPTTEWDD